MLEDGLLPEILRDMGEIFFHVSFSYQSELSIIIKWLDHGRQQEAA